MFHTPVVLLTFLRDEKIKQILQVIEKVCPQRLYLISDNGRNEAEKEYVSRLRANVEAFAEKIGCELVKNYAEENRGVYANIALGAKWVFEREETAIFLEDDNLPDESFFPFCEEMLEKYADEERIICVCGTNYLQRYLPPDGSDYVFSTRMQPCGWASWSNKFGKYYRDAFDGYGNSAVRRRIRKSSEGYGLYLHERYFWKDEYEKIRHGKRPSSWDGQMQYSMYFNDLFAIVPKNNLIENIGIDAVSVHGGISAELNEMTARFCLIKRYPLQFPLRHPDGIYIDKAYEELSRKIVTPPFLTLLRVSVSRIIKSILQKDLDKPLIKKPSR